MGKSNVLDPYNGILINNEKEWCTDMLQYRHVEARHKDHI
jgi:hypothetical protein